MRSKALTVDVTVDDEWNVSEASSFLQTETESSFAPNVSPLITNFLRAGGLDITQESISGVGIDYGAHLQGVATKQYKTINATAPLSKARRENSEPRMAGARARRRGKWV